MSAPSPLGTSPAMSRFRALLAALLLSLTFTAAACSAEGNVDTGGKDGDGVKIEGDVDAKK